MASLLHLKKRITTAQNVSKTTKAMQLIAASKLKRAQTATLAGRPYIEKLSSITKQNLKTEGKIESPYLLSEAKTENEIVIAFAPDKGLCGSLVSSMLFEAYKIIEGKKNVSLILIGNKLEKLQLSQNALASFPLGTSLPAFDIIFPVLQLIEDTFLKGEVKEVNILYPKFVSLFTQTPTHARLLPLTIQEEENEEKEKFTVFEPRIQELLPSLLRHYLEINLYQFFLETYLSEQAARMISMKNATDNATDVIADLKLEYNKTRQEKITNEILDIGSAAIAQAI